MRSMTICIANGTTTNSTNYSIVITQVPIKHPWGLTKIFMTMTTSNMSPKYTKKKSPFKEVAPKIKIKDLSEEVERAVKEDPRISKHKGAAWVQKGKRAVIFSEYILLLLIIKRS